MNFQNKTVVVTGSSRGIGRAIAAAFAAKGANVVLNASKSQAELEQTVKQLRAAGGSVIGVMADVSTYEGCQNLFQAAHTHFGDVHILINNAGISHIGLFSDMTPAQWQKLLQVNLESVFGCTHCAIPTMLHHKSGCIINISSMWGISGASCEAVYAATKGAIHAFTKSIAKELGPSGIRCNAIACGVIDTAMNQWLSAEEAESLTDEIPLCRFGQTKEVADCVLYLASEQSSYLTGQVITLDGGML